MQIQKKTVKSKIINAALEEFLISGYSNSSMRNIANQSGITVGNIYSYFASKEDLFEHILSSTVKQLQALFEMEVGDGNLLTTRNVTEMAHEIAVVFLRNRIQFLILMDGSEGSKYGNIKSELIEQATQRIISESKSDSYSSSAGIDETLAYSISVALIEGMIYLFKNIGNDKSRLEKLIGEFLRLILGDLFQKI